MSTATKPGYHFHYLPTTEKYEYGPLVSTSHIRLLILHELDETCRNVEVPLTGTILQSKIESEMEYNVLCSVPDSRPATKFIETPEGNIPITPTLHDAISALRRVATGATLLWTPEVSIDTATEQVPIIKHVQNMKKIYQNAMEVIVHLGEDPEDTGEAHEFFYKLSMMELSNLPVSFNDLSRAQLPPVTDKLWAAADRFLCRPWFRSIQALPACIWAKELRFIGEKWSMDASMFVAGLVKARALPFPVFGHGISSDELVRGGRCFSLYASLRVHCATSGAHFRFSELLERCRLAEAETTLERLAVLAAVSDTGNSSGPWDNKDENLGMDQTDEAIRIVRYFFDDTNEGLKLLSLARGYVPGSETPSWMPDMSADIDRRDFDYSEFECATGHDPRGSITSIEERKLSIFCAPIPCSCSGHNTIAAITKLPVQAGPAWPSVLAQWKHAQALCGSLRSETGEPPTKYQDTEEPILSAIWATHRKGKADGINNSQVARSMASAKAIFLALNRDDMVSVATENFDSASKVVGVIAAELHGWRFCVTQTGYMALVPEESEIGDIIVVVRGAQTPILFRTLSGTKEYQLIGPCYVHGVMSGELKNKLRFGMEVLV